MRWITWTSPRINEYVAVITKSNNMFVTMCHISEYDNKHAWSYRDMDIDDEIIGWYPIPQIPQRRYTSDEIIQACDPITRLCLSVRARQCLINAGLLTIQEVLDKGRDSLLLIRNFGLKTREEVEDALKESGFNLE